MNTNEAYVKCLHCEGTGICRQRTVETKEEKVSRTERARDNDGDYYDREVYDYTSVYKKCICKICGEGAEVEVQRRGSSKPIDIVREPEQLICKVCTGSGYIGLVPNFLRQGTSSD